MMTRMEKDCKLRQRQHYAGGIWKLIFHSENVSKVCHPHYSRGIWNQNSDHLFWICVRVKLGVVMSSFSQSSVLKSSPFTPEKSEANGLKSRFETLCFRDGLVWTIGRTVEIKLVFRILLSGDGALNCQAYQFSSSASFQRQFAICFTKAFFGNAIKILFAVLNNIAVRNVYLFRWSNIYM